jgi:alpha-L-rhamnosidase
MSSISRRAFITSTTLAATVTAAAAQPSQRQTKAKLSVDALQTEYTTHLFGTEAEHPRLSWKMGGSGRGLKQRSYRIRAATSREGLAIPGQEIWDSGAVQSDRTFDVKYAGPAVKSQQRIWWSVEIRDNLGRIATSDATWFEAGLLAPDDWKAEWLVAEDAQTAADRAAGLKWIWIDPAIDKRPRAFRLDFVAPDEMERAEVFVTAKNWMDGVWFNGEAVDMHKPRFSSWGTLKAVPVVVTPGKNSLCVLVSIETEDLWPVTPGGLASLIRLHLKDGSVRRIVSGDGWRGMVSPPEDWYGSGGQALPWQVPYDAYAHIMCDPMPAEPGMLMRHVFTPKAKVVNARLYATALGAYDARINGKAASDTLLAPEISVASEHVLYQVFDVTSLVTEGDNVIGAAVADGWYASAFTWQNQRYSFGPAPRRLAMQLRLDYVDGTSSWVMTGADWRVGTSPVITSEIYNGEVYDASLESPGWDTISFKPVNWSPAKIGQRPDVRLVPQTSPGLKKLRQLRAQKVTQPRPGVYVFDFGQNSAGLAKLKVKGAKGDTVTLRFAEYLKTTGEIDQSNLREALAKDVYILRGDPTGETYEPRFTYHGFRYVQVEGYPGHPTADDLVAICISSACAETGNIQFENALVQQFWTNALWSQRSNFFGVPTDCPQRDERLGWMGDLQDFLDAAAFNMDVDAFIRRFLLEVRAGQAPDGGYPIVIPKPRSFGESVTAGWSEAGLILPWTLWMRYGDTAVIDENWSAMTAWMDYLSGQNPDYVWRNGRGCDLGDWLSVDAVNPADETTPRILCATAYWAFCARIMRDLAGATGRQTEAKKYEQLLSNIRAAFAENLVKADGVAGNGSQTSQVLALNFDLVPEALKPAAAKVLVDDIKKRGMKLSTGFLGTPYLLDVLADAGYVDIVSGLLLQTQYPSWGHMPMMGATTMWERWDGDAGDPSMNSYNHYAYGAVCGFFYRRLGGIAPASPGFQRIKVAPLFLPAVGWVKASYVSCVGRIATEIDGDAKGLGTFKLTLPPNTVAEVLLPANFNWKEGGRPIAGRDDMKVIGNDGHQVSLELGSGDYVFVR